MHLKDYKDEDFDFYYKFNTRFRISKWLLFYLLASDVLRLKKVTFDGSRAPGSQLAEDGEEVKEVQKESSAESLVKLLFRGSNTKCQARADEWDLSDVQLQLDDVERASFCMWDTSNRDFGHFERLLNRNAKRYSARLHASVFQIPSSSKNVADRAEEFRLEIRSSGPLQNYEAYLERELEAEVRYIRTICPGMKKIRLEVPRMLGMNQFEPLTQWIFSLNTKLTSGNLKAEG